MLAETASLESHTEKLAESVVERCFRAHPELDLRYGPIGRTKCLQDTKFHIQYLIRAISVNSLTLFLDYVQWAKVMLAGVKVPERDFIFNLDLLRQAIAEQPADEAGEIAQEFLRAAIKAMPEMSATTKSLVDPSGRNGQLALTYLNLILAGQRREATEFIMRAVDTGTSIQDIYLRVFQPVQREIGRLWQTNQITVAQEHYCTAVTQLVMSMLYPRMFSTKKNGFRLLACCVGSELHEIGVRMVADFLEVEGWDTFYLGANTPLPSIVKTVKDRKIHVVAISATMTYHIELVSRIISALRGEKETRDVKILVGGYPFNIEPELWKTLGADGYAPDAQATAVEAAKMVRL